jgi:protein arginine N-methyltransferase 2
MMNRFSFLLFLFHHHQVKYDGDKLLDSDDDAVMMEWERPLMDAHASIMTNDGKKGMTVMNIGFGMGIIDEALQKLSPSKHLIVEAHPDVYAKMLKDGWDKKPNVEILFGKWQDVIPSLIAFAGPSKFFFDGIFFDTYGEHFSDMEDFHSLVLPPLLRPVTGIYSFFNGLSPDNIFFHGVACNCVQIQLEAIGLNTEFIPCEIQVKNEDWLGVRRKYWHFDQYFLPRCTWMAKENSTEENTSAKKAKTTS